MNAREDRDYMMWWNVNHKTGDPEIEYSAYLYGKERMARDIQMVVVGMGWFPVHHRSYIIDEIDSRFLRGLE